MFYVCDLTLKAHSIVIEAGLTACAQWLHHHLMSTIDKHKHQV